MAGMVTNVDDSSAHQVPVPIGPGRLPLFGHALSLLRHPLEFITSLRAHGDVVLIYLGTLPAYVITDPVLAYRVLTLEAGKFGKGILIEKFRPYFGNGLALSTGDFYRRQRRLVQPAFHRDRILGYARTMLELATAMVDGWRPGEVVQVDQRMRELSLAVVARTLFSTELGGRAADEVQRYTPILLRDGIVRAFSPRLLERLPIPANRRFDDAIARVRRVVAEVVTEARAAGTDHGDLLSTLLLARDPETGERMDDRQVHDEVVTLLTAGIDTSAIALAWFFHEIARHPAVERRFHAEVDAAGPITVDILPRLTYTRQIIDEVLRTHGPWLLMRRALTEVDLGPVRLPAGAEVAISPHATHLDPAVYPDPERFDPDRWSAGVPKEFYVPFAAGLHSCPGQQFAQTEIALVAATVAARWRLVPVPGKPVRTKVLGIVYPSRLPMTAVPRHG